MKPLFFFFLFSLLSKIIIAQGKVELSGQVKDSQTKNALEFCAVSILNAKDSLISGTISDNKGFFTALLDQGNYRFVLSYLGYKSDTSELFLVREKKFVGVFKLEANTNILREVSVTESSHENLLDRDVQIVTDKMREGASSAKDVLDKVNGVDYDRYSNSIKVDNDSKVIILVDGLEKDQEYIKNLSPDRMKKIEVIRDPAGRYALEGYSAVINIILKKDYAGTEIFASERNMTDPDAVKTTYIPFENGVSSTINYVYNKLNVYAKFSNKFNNINLLAGSKKDYENGFMIEKSPSVADDMNLNIAVFSNDFTMGSDYFINPKNTVSFESNVQMHPFGRNLTRESYTMSYGNYGTVTEKFNTVTKNESGNVSSYNSLFYEGKIDENNIINSNFTFSDYSGSYANIFTRQDLYNRTEIGKNKRNNTKFYTEFTHTFKNKTSLQSGYGNTWETLKNTFSVDTLVSRFNYLDFRHRLYAYYSWQKSEKFGIKAGAAGETSSPNSNGLKRFYFIFRPHADVKYKVSKIIDFKLKYRANTNYPRINQTNPFVSIIDQHTVGSGNPGLSPELIHKVSLQTNILSGLLTIEPYYHFSRNFITQTGKLRTDSIFEYNYSNAGNFEHSGAKGSFTVPLNNSFFLQSEFNFFKSRIRYENTINQIKDWTLESKLIYQSQKTGTVALIQYQNNMFKDIIAQGYNKEGNDFWMMLVQQPFLKKRLTVMVLYFIPVSWGIDYDQGNYIDTENYTETKFVDLGFLTNMVMVEISYRFNKGKTISKTDKNIEKNEEKYSKGLF